MNEINFMTIGDNHFFPFVNYSIKKILKFYPNSKFYIYDWGFKERQKKILKSYPITEIICWVEKLDRKAGYKQIIRNYEGFDPKIDYRRKEYLWIQKPKCILDCAKRIKENLFYIDGDAFLLNPIDEIFNYDFDIGVTIYLPDMVEEWRKRGVSGNLNAGIIFFKTKSELIQLFIQAWIKEIKITKVWLIEQNSLNNIIERNNKDIYNKYYNEGYIDIMDKKIKVMTFPWEIYNYHLVENGFDPSQINIIHLLRRTNLVKKLIIEFKLRYFLAKFFRIFPNFVKNQFFQFTDFKSLTNFLYEHKKIKIIKEKLLHNLNINSIRTLISIKKVKIHK